MRIQTDQLDTLTRINIQDFCESFGLSRRPVARGLIKWLIWPAARRFAHLLVDYDRQVGESGLQTAAIQAMNRFVAGVEIAGYEALPVAGPALILSNHPGLSDTLVLFSALPTGNLRVIAAERAFLRALPHTSRYLIEVPEQTSAGLPVIRGSS